jgi:hypothetical protein
VCQESLEKSRPQLEHVEQLEAQTAELEKKYHKAKVIIKDLQHRFVKTVIAIPYHQAAVRLYPMASCAIDNFLQWLTVMFSTVSNG